MQETQGVWVQSLGWEDPLDEGIASAPVFLPGKVHGQPDGLQSMRLQRGGQN